MQKMDFEDYLAITSLVIEWADSYDNKAWDRLREILAPVLMIDYRDVGHRCFPEMPQDAFIEMISAPGFLGDPLVRTQHLIGASRYECISKTELIGNHQIRAAHVRYNDLDRSKVDYRGHGHAMVRHWYKKENGVWKLAGVCPQVYWNEYDFDEIFPQLRMGSEDC